ncbi:unnamed protein product [Peniophora sp. CBMAI 1063]|nr:unnamed protein product [Peniophora sp. CBMAI 1063]
MQSSTLSAFNDSLCSSLVHDAPDWTVPTCSIINGFDLDQLMTFDTDFKDATSVPDGFGTGNGRVSLDPLDPPSLQAEAEDTGPSSIRVSTAFAFDAPDAEGNTPDFDLITSDGVHFAVNAAALRAHSFGDFGGILASTNSMANVPLSAAVLNLLLHAIYNLSVVKYAPSLEDLAASVIALEQYGLSKTALVQPPDSPLSVAILHCAPSRPFQCYSLAAHEGLETLAIATSSHTLGVSLAEISDADAEYMGPLHLKRLFFLHLGRIDALKRILSTRPSPHQNTEDCNGLANRASYEAWTKIIGEIVWDACPNISPITLEVRLLDVGKMLKCHECLSQLDHRINNLVAEWSLVKTTI